MDDFLFVVLGLLGLLFLAMPVLVIILFVKLSSQTARISAIEQYLLRLKREGVLAPLPTLSQPTDTAAATASMQQPEPQVVSSPITPDESNRRPLPAAAQMAPSKRGDQRPKHRKSTMERSLAQNWMVWVGGLALAIGGLLMVGVAIEAGILTEDVRVALSAGFGAALIGAGWFSRTRNFVTKAEGALTRLPEILTGAGILSLFGAGIGAGPLYDLFTPMLVLGWYVAVSALAIALSLKYGSRLAAIGLAGAYLAPFITGATDGSPLPLLPYVAIVTVANLILVRAKNWTWTAWIALVGSGLWGLIGAGESGQLAGWMVPVYALVIGAIGLILGEREAREHNGILPFKEFLTQLHQSVVAAHAFWAMVGGLIYLTGLTHPKAALVPMALAFYAGGGLLASWQRKGYGFVAIMSAVVAVLCMAAWPEGLIDIRPLTLALAIGFGFGGVGLMIRAQNKLPLALVGALTPPAMLFVAFWRGGGLEPNFAWGLVALLVAVSLGGMMEFLSRREDRDDAVLATFATGTGLTAVLAPFMMLDGIWLSPALVILASVLALVWQRYPFKAIRLAGLGALGLGTFILLPNFLLENVFNARFEAFAEMSGVHWVGIIAAAIGAWLTRPVDRVEQAYEGAAWLILMGWIGYTIRYIATGGDIYDNTFSLSEACAYAVSYLAATAVLTWRVRQGQFLLRVLQAGAAALSSVSIVLLFIRTLESHSVGSLAIINLLLAGYLLPAMILFALAYLLQRKQQRILSRVAGGLGMTLSLIWVSLETLNIANGLGLNGGAGSDLWMFSVSWLVFAFVLLAVAVVLDSRMARFGSLGVLILAILKVFIIDLAELEGIARAFSFIGLGTALILAALFYQKFVFKTGASLKSDQASA